jgi:HemY protein
MRLIIFVIAILFIAILTTLMAVEDPGYVLIARMPWSVEMPLTVFVPVLVASYFACYGAFYALVRLWRIPRDVARWRARRHLLQSRVALNTGLVHLAEGSWVEAEAELIAGMRFSDAPVLNCLGAAIASQGQGNIEKRDDYLAQAQTLAPQQNLSIGMTQAILQHVAHQPERALATLNELRTQLPRHRFLLNLLAQVFLELRDWTGLVELIPELRATLAMTPAEIEAIELQTHRELLTLSLPRNSVELLKRAWNAVPKPLRVHPALVVIYARQLIRQNEVDEAEALLRHAIDAEWDDALVELYGEVRTPAPADALDTVEGWLVSHPDNAKLLLAAARQALAAGQKPKAHDYLEKCVNLGGPAVAYRELGELFERAGEKDRALEFYRRGLDSVTETPQQANPRNRPSRVAR